jgi:AbrB family looped-hinge helix DNA binding protein
MEIVTVSPKYQIIIPKRVREMLQIHPNHKIQVIVYDGRIELIPLTPIKEARGFLKGKLTDSTIEREREERI